MKTDQAAQGARGGTRAATGTKGTDSVTLPRASRRKERLSVLIVVALLLFCPPLLLVVDGAPDPGISWLPLYLFTAWGLVIGLAAWLLEGRGRG